MRVNKLHYRWERLMSKRYAGYNKFYTAFFVLNILALSLCFSISFATPAITPSCSAGQSQELGLIQTTYDKTGYNHPSNHSQYETLVSNYAIPANLFGSGVAAQINGSGNPYGSDSNYLTIFTGFFEVPTTGVYGIGIDGDDAVEVIIDEVTITGWYGGHGRAGSAQFTVNVSLDAGYHTIEFRHEEVGGGDNYYLYWRPPGSGSFTIVPPANFSSCQDPPTYLPAITPNCLAPSPQLQLSTYDTTGYGTYPNNHSQYNSLVSSYAIPSNLFGSGTVVNVNGSGNPYGPNDDYLSIFTGYIFAPTTGIYFLGVDGDDAVEVLIDGQAISGYYGAHGQAGSPQSTTSVALNSGYHTVEFRHQERGGGDNYFLYWQQPGASSMSIVAGSSLSHCPLTTTISLQKTKVTVSDPINLTTNPKAIPGAIVRYTLTALNNGPNTADSAVISDNLNNVITTQQFASWVPGRIFIMSPNLYAGNNTNLTDANDSDEGQFIDSAGNRTLQVNCGSLAINQSCIVTYELEIN